MFLSISLYLFADFLKINSKLFQEGWLVIEIYASTTCVAVSCSVHKCGAVCLGGAAHFRKVGPHHLRCSVLQRVAVYSEGAACNRNLGPHDLRCSLL